MQVNRGKSNGTNNARTYESLLVSRLCTSRKKKPGRTITSTEWRPDRGGDSSQNNSSNSCFAALRSAVVNPSVKRAYVRASSLCACPLRACFCWNRERLVAVRSCHDKAPCCCARAKDFLK